MIGPSNSFSQMCSWISVCPQHFFVQCKCKFHRKVMTIIDTSELFRKVAKTPYTFVMAARLLLIGMSLASRLPFTFRNASAALKLPESVGKY